jgi:hypothetical protein
MRRVIQTSWRKPPAPHAWAIEANGTLQSVHVPIRPDGSNETGDATLQRSPWPIFKQRWQLRARRLRT